MVNYRGIGKRVGNVVRLAEVVRVLVMHGFADLVRRFGLAEGIPARLLRGLKLLDAPSGAPETMGARLRSVFTELGPTFVKFGQVLSTRPDILPPSLCDDLALLQDKVRVIPFEVMRPIIEGSLGKSLDDTFAEFDSVPVASASLSQVYKARLRTGETVAVKVQRPGIEKVIESDLSLMHAIAEWLTEHVRDLIWLDPPAVIDEFTRSIRRELDFTVESRMIDRFREGFATVDEVHVPMTYPDVSGPRMLVLEWIDGIRVDAVEAYAERNCDPKVIAVNGCRALCRQVFDLNLFHADPHPANIFITRDNRIVFLDYGMIGHLERGDAKIIADLMYAIFQEDVQACVNALLLLTAGDEPVNRDAFEHELGDFLVFQAQAAVGSGKVGETISYAMDILRRYQIRMAPRFSLLLKAMGTIESVGHTLDPELNMLPVLQPYVAKLIRERYSPRALARATRQDMLELLHLGRQIPREVNTVLHMLQKGQVKVQLTHERLEHIAAVADRASNRIAFGVITGSLIIGSSLLIRSGAGAAGLGLAGYLIAGLLGLSLIVSILRSRNY